MGQGGYFPGQFASRGKRLAFDSGTVVLAIRPNSDELAALVQRPLAQPYGGRGLVSSRIAVHGGNDP